MAKTATRLWRRFLRSEAGAAGIWAVLALPVVSAGAALSVDITRMQSLDHDLQSAADAWSRAAAAELDQAPDSITRAERVLAGLVTNTQRGDDIALSNVALGGVRYLERLPEPSWSEITPDMVTTDPARARYVEVSVAPETVNAIFPSSTLKRFASVTLDARSVAGLDIGVCGSAPVFICNPMEGQTTSIHDAVKTADFRRRQFSLIEAGPNASYTPGNFGWLDPFDNNSGANVLRDQIARTVSDVCVSKSRGVALRPGKIASMSHGFNTKFDIYEHSFASKADDPLYAPAANVTKGQANGGVCGADNGGDGGGSGKGKGKGKGKATPDPDVTPVAMGFGRDGGTDSVLGARVGDGDWDFLTYMSVNHPGENRVTLDGVTYRINANAGTVSPSTPPSRYSVYRWEIDTNNIPGQATARHASVPAEEGQPVCNTHPRPDGVDPRILSVAVINCTAVQNSGISMNGRTSGIPVETFVKVFLTEPMGKGQDNVMRGEIIGTVSPDSDTASRDRVAVVR